MAKPKLVSSEGRLFVIEVTGTNPFATVQIIQVVRRGTEYVISQLMTDYKGWQAIVRAVEEAAREKED